MSWTALLAGRRAHGSGQALSACPYPPGDHSADAKAWRRGWIDAEADRRAATGRFGTGQPVVRSRAVAREAARDALDQLQAEVAPPPRLLGGLSPAQQQAVSDVVGDVALALSETGRELVRMAGDAWRLYADAVARIEARVAPRR